uniref:Uncharacterized protein n=1 Tax=Arundo donax TaxID=35708 RepID=A0A0A8Y5X0_ARUDO
MPYLHKQLSCEVCTYASVVIRNLVDYGYNPRNNTCICTYMFGPH